MFKVQDVKCEAVNCENVISLEFDTPVFIYFTDQLADYHMPRLFTLDIVWTDFPIAYLSRLKSITFNYSLCFNQHLVGISL